MPRWKITKVQNVVYVSLKQNKWKKKSQPTVLRIFGSYNHDSFVLWNSKSHGKNAKAHVIIHSLCKCMFSKKTRKKQEKNDIIGINKTDECRLTLFSGELLISIYLNFPNMESNPRTEIGTHRNNVSLSKASQVRFSQGRYVTRNSTML